MVRNEVNENYKHVCCSSKVNITNYICSLSDSNYTHDEFKRIIEFYVLKAPILKSDKKDSFGLKNLKEYGWTGSSHMGKLERELLKTSQIQMFCFIRSSSIKNTLTQMELDSCICVDHPRAVMMQSFNIEALENGEIKISNGETRMECLFRHIRN